MSTAPPVADEVRGREEPRRDGHRGIREVDHLGRLLAGTSKPEQSLDDASRVLGLRARGRNLGCPHRGISDNHGERVQELVRNRATHLTERCEPLHLEASSFRLAHGVHHPIECLPEVAELVVPLGCQRHDAATTER